MNHLNANHSFNQPLRRKRDSLNRFASHVHVLNGSPCFTAKPTHIHSAHTYCYLLHSLRPPMELELLLEEEGHDMKRNSLLVKLSWYQVRKKNDQHQPTFNHSGSRNKRLSTNIFIEDAKELGFGLLWPCNIQGRNEEKYLRCPRNIEFLGQFFTSN